jgi:hypothetical protein
MEEIKKKAGLICALMVGDFDDILCQSGICLGEAKKKYWIVQHTILRFCLFLLSVVVSFVLFLKYFECFFHAVVCTYSLARFRFVLIC